MAQALATLSTGYAMPLRPGKFDKLVPLEPATAAIAVQRLAGRTGTGLRGWIIEEVSRSIEAVPTLALLGPVPLAEQLVGNPAFDALLEQTPDIVFRMKAAIGGDGGMAEHVAFLANGLEIFPGGIDHRMQQLMLLRFAESLRMHHDLVLGIDYRQPVIALQHAMTGLHLGAIVIRHVAFFRAAPLARLVIVLA